MPASFTYETSTPSMKTSSIAQAFSWLIQASTPFIRGRRSRSLTPVSTYRLENRIAAGLWIDLGNAYARLYHREEALAAYDKALALDPDSTTAWSIKGGVLLSAYRDKEAVAAFEEALLVDFYDAMAHYNLGVAHDRLRHYDEAIYHYQVALTLDPTLKNPSVNPNIVNNDHVQILRLRLYRDAGGALALPLRPGESP